MNSGRTVFSQLIQHLPEKEFQKCVARYNGDSNFRGFSCWDQLLAMAFAQLTYRESLRDIESCLRALQSKLYHMGFRGKVSRSTLADANESHDWRIFAEFAQVLIGIARPLHAHDPIGVDLDQSLYALDSTTIDLCLSLFPWAKFRRRKAAVKMHTLLDLHGNIPTFIRVTSGDVHDVNILDEIMPEAGSFYIMDRAYIDFQRLFVFTLSSAFFVVRTKSNVLIQRRYSHPVDKRTGVRSDQTVILTSFESASAYPDALRRVSYLDKETQKRLKFLTNNFVLPAFTIAQIYKCRWQVELFFKWIKQHLRIKAFYGTSENAVKTQIWIAVSIYVLVAIVRKRLDLAASLYQTLQILSITLFEKTPILWWRRRFHTKRWRMPEDPIINSSPIGFLSSSFEPLTLGTEIDNWAVASLEIRNSEERMRIQQVRPWWGPRRLILFALFCTCSLEHGGGLLELCFCAG